MTQHTQPVVAAQHHQQQQQQHQQQQTTTTPNSNNNNVSNNNNSNTTPTTTTNNNQTQTVAVQQHQSNNNNNNNNSYQNVSGGGQMFNPQIPSYVPTHGMPAHHHPSHQHHNQPGAMYQTMTPAAIPSTVFVNNVTANVNLHGWAHTVPHGAWVHPSGAPQYIHGEFPPEQGGPVLQPIPVALPAPNTLGGPLMNPNPTGISGGSRGSHRGRGRGGGSGSKRGDYNMQRHPQSEGSPAPQQHGQNNPQDMQQQQSGQAADAQQMMTTLQPSYMTHPQYAAHAAQYPYGYPTYFTQQPMIHPGQSSAAQQATGTPLYFSAMPVYNGPPVYNYGYYLPPVMNQSEYPYAEEVGVGDERQAAGEGAMMWHQAPMYADEYGMTPADMHAVASDDMNHNASSMGSANETPNLLSPNYPPMYEQMTQQMGVMQIYEDPQMGQMQVMHPQGAVPQMEEELSECGSQPSTTMQMVPQPIQMVPAAAPMSLPTAAAASNEQILQQQQQTPHMIPVTTGGAIMPIDNSLTPQTTPQHQVQQQQQQQPTVTGDNTNESNIQTTYENVSQIQPGESVTILNEELAQSTNADNLAPVTTNEYQQQQIAPQQQQQQQQQVQTQSVLVEAVQTDNYNVQEVTDNSQQKTSKTVATVTAISTSTDVAIETIATNVVTNRQQQAPVYQHQQQQHHNQERSHKQQQQQHHQQQYMGKQNVPQQQQQYQHQQLQTQSITAVPQTQQQTTHYQSSNQHQQQQQHHYSQQQQQHHHSQHQQHHQPQHQQQQSYDNRKSSQMYQQQHQSRNRKYDYHHNDGGHQQQSQQQTTKSMSWTNSSQHKKSTNTVGVTATPTSSHSSGGSYNKSSNATNSSTTHTHATRTYTNQHHTNYQQQQNYHYQQQQQQHQQPSTRNHAAMKMPSSPIASGPNNPMERKTSQSSDAGKQQQQQQQTTSTASTTAAPHQFQTPQQHQQQQQSQQTSTSDMVQQQQTPISTTTAAAASSATPVSSNSNTNSSSKQSTQQSQHYPPGFATKKHSISNQGHSSSNSASNTATNTANATATTTAATNNNVESTSTSTSTSTNTPAINLAPPVSNNTPASTSTTWASLFASNSNTNNSSNTSNAAVSSSNNLAASTANTSSSSTTAYSKKPVAKVAPYEGITPVTPPPPVQTPGNLSYSAASAQNLPPPAATSAATAKKSSLVNEQQSQRNTLANLDEYSIKFAEFLTKYKSDWAPISLRPRGLTNRSNYCYINSILQALLGCSPLYNLIRSIPKQAANLCEVKTPTVNAMITFMSNFSNLPSGLRLRNAKGGKGNKDDLGGDLQCDPAFEPTEIYKLWNDSREEHVEGRQEDAEEFLSYILNKLNDEMLEVIKLIAKPNPEQNGQNEPPEEDGDAWQMICNNRNKGSITRQTDFGCTPLSDIFRGELRSRLQREGELSTDIIQPFFTLQLNIEKAASVKEALEILVGRDQLEGVTASKSKQEVVAWQQMNLEKLPPILILHLKWFDYRSDGCTKILKKVEFPVELKIDTKILASKNYSQKKRAYRLFAVVYHDGKEATKGHYITDVYHTGYGSWLRYDDSSVKPVSENHVLLPRTPRVPYLLCYRRCDTIPQQSNQNNSSSGNNNSSGNTQTSSGK